jgi:hypothetical protein
LIVAAALHIMARMFGRQLGSSRVSGIRLSTSLTWGLLLGLCVACQRNNEGPKVASSAEQVGYAERYPEELGRVEASLLQSHGARQRFAEFRQYPSELNEPDWNLVREIYEAADAEGRAQAYAQRAQQEHHVKSFFEDEKKPLVGRVSAGVQHAAKEKGVEDFQAYGAVAFSLERGVDQQLQERRRADSTAHALIEEQAPAVGKKNVPALEKHADTLAWCSYAVHVRAMLDERELQRLLDDASAVKSTLEERKAALAASPKPNPKAVQRVDEALAALDERVEKARAALENVRDRQQQLQSEYAQAFEALLDEVERRADAAGRDN